MDGPVVARRMVSEPEDDVMRGVLERAQRAGFLGPGDVRGHIAHAHAMAAFAGLPSGPVLDLGSGGGVPGLVLAVVWPDAELVVLDAQHRRAEHLRESVRTLGLGGRVDVVEGRAEVVARDPRWRGRFEVAVARSFGPPPVTAECAVGFLRAGGRVVVADAPGGVEARWPAEGLARLGLSLVRRAHVEGATFVELHMTGTVGDRWPRRDGTPTRRPLW